MIKIRTLNCIYVKNLPWTAGKKEIRNYFSKFGRIYFVKLPYDYDTGFTKGYGFIYYENKISCDKALEVQHHIIDDKKVLVTACVKNE